MTIPMNEKIKQLHAKYMTESGDMLLENILEEAIAYGRSSALAEVEASLPELRKKWWANAMKKNNNNYDPAIGEIADFFEQEIQSLISSKRKESEK